MKTPQPKALNNLRRLIFVSAFMGGIVLLLNFVADNPYSHKFLRYLINRSVEKYTNVSLDFRAVKVSVVPLGLDLYGFEVNTQKKEKEKESKKLFSSSHIKLRISIWSIVIGNPRFGLLELSDAEIQWPLAIPLDKILKDSGEEKPETPLIWPPPIRQLPLERLSLRNARIFAEIAETDSNASNQLPIVVAAFSGVDLDLDIADLSNIGIELNVIDANLKLKEFQVLSKSELSLATAIAPDRIRKSQIKIRAPDLTADGKFSGKILTASRTSELEAINLDGDFSADGELTFLGKVLDIEDTSGDVNGKGDFKLELPIGQPKAEPVFLITANAKVEQGQIDGFQIFESSADLEADLDELRFKNGKGLIGNQNIGNFNGKIGFDSTIPIDFNANLHGLKFHDLMRALKVKDFDTVAAQIYSPSLSVKGLGDPLQLTIAAKADFENLNFPKIKEAGNELQLIDPTCRVALNLSVSETKLNFDKAEGSCFTRSSKEGVGVIGAGNILTPLDAANIAPLRISGFVTFKEEDGLKLRFTNPNSNLTGLAPLFGVSANGVGTAETTVFGPYSDIKVRSIFDTSGLSVLGVDLGNTSGQILLSQGNKLSWERLLIEPKSGGTIVSEQGNLLLDSLQMHAKIEAKQIDSGVIKRAFELLDLRDVEFAINELDASVNLPLREPLRLVGDLSANLGNVEISQTRLAEKFLVKVDANRDQIKIKQANLNNKDLRVNGSGNIERGNAGQISSELTKILNTLGLSPNSQSNIKISIDSPESESSASGSKTAGKTTGLYDHLQLIPGVAEYAKNAKISGQIRGTVEIKGTIAQPSVDFDLDLFNARFMQTKIAPTKAKGTLSANKQLKFSVSHDAGALTGDVNINLAQNKLPYSWNLKAKRFDLRSIMTTYFSKDPRNFAYFDGNWEMSGNMLDWWRSTGSLQLENLLLRYVSDSRTDISVVDLHNEKSLRLLIGPSGWYFDGNQDLNLLSEQAGLKLSLKGNHPPEKLSIKMDANFEVSSLKNIIPDLESATGRLLFSGEIKGSAEDPHYKFRLREDDNFKEPLMIGFTQLRPAFTNVRMDIRFEDESIIVNSLTADKGKGRVTASGRINLNDSQSDLSRLDFSLMNATFISQVAVIKTFESELSGNISLTGNRFPLLLSGDLQVTRARSTRNFDLRDQIISAFQQRNFESVSQPRDPLLSFDLRISANSSISIYNRNIQTVLSSNLNLTGNDVAPVVLGQIEVDKGVFAYKYRRDFRITQGIITFDDPVKADPRLDILSVSDLNGYRVFLAITGRASDPKIDLSIDPPTREDGSLLTKVDILILMSTGSLPERQRSEIATQDAAKVEALNLIVGQLEQPVEKLFDMSGQTVVQQVYIDSYAGPDGQPTPRLNLPLNLHQDWDVIFRVDNNTQKLSVGYKVDENVSLSGSVDRQSRDDQSRQATSAEPKTTGVDDTGVDLKFRFSFP